MALDPAQLAATTTAIATLIFSKALEKGGEHMGDAVYQRFGQLVQSIQTQFQAQGSMETFTETEADPSEQNLGQFTHELADLMAEDETLAAAMEDFLTTFAEETTVKEILSQTASQSTDLDHTTLASQPLSVAHFKEPATDTDPAATKTPSPGDSATSKQETTTALNSEQPSSAPTMPASSLKIEDDPTA